MHLFDLLHDYQHLRAKASLVPLAATEAVRLEGLDQLLRAQEDGESGSRRKAPRFGFPRALGVSIVPRASVGFIAAGLREIGAEGAALSLDHPLVPEQPLILYFDDEARGLRYEFPARLVWQARGQAGIRFEGMPSRRPWGGARAA